MTVTLYFDTTCPFTWITSRWLLQVNQQRQFDLIFKPFSLALKNKDKKLPNGQPNPNPDQYKHNRSLRTLRLMSAANQQGANIIDLYNSFGTAYHLDKKPLDDELIKQILATLHLPTSLITAADDEMLDAQLQQSIDSATSVVGNNIGVPTIVFQNDQQSPTGFYGPVLQAFPDPEQSLKLWDSILALSAIPNFFELKRIRPKGQPDVSSTAI